MCLGYLAVNYAPVIHLHLSELLYIVKLFYIMKLFSELSADHIFGRKNIIKTQIKVK